MKKTKFRSLNSILCISAEELRKEYYFIIKYPAYLGAYIMISDAVDHYVKLGIMQEFR
jgi:hypothetical protein